MSICPTSAGRMYNESSSPRKALRARSIGTLEDCWMSATFRYAPDHFTDKQTLSIEELGRLAKKGGKPAETLMNVAALIAGRFATEVCSAYLLEPDRATLVLAATVGLRPTCIGRLRLGLHEGLVGLVAETLQPVAVEQPAKHPRFRFFHEAGEEPYQSFLGVPVLDRGVLQGVLVIQTAEVRVFDADEVCFLSEVATQVAPIISEARTLGRFIGPTQERLWALA